MRGTVNQIWPISVVFPMWPSARSWLLYKMILIKSIIITADIYCVCHITHYAKRFTCLCQLVPPILYATGTVLSSLYRWGNWGIVKVKEVATGKHLVTSRGGHWTLSPGRSLYDPVSPGTTRLWPLQPTCLHAVFTFIYEPSKYGRVYIKHPRNCSAHEASIFESSSISSERKKVECVPKWMCINL